MTQTKNTRKWEFGDFQTPANLAQDIVAYLKKFNPGFQPKTIIEPTCGVGSFLLAAADKYPKTERVIGLEIEAEYLNAVRSKIATRKDADRFDLREADFFQTDWANLLANLPKPFLIVGNPPWVTSADIGRVEGTNLPVKSNFQKYIGLDAITGKANFDISEFMLIRNLKWIKEYNGCLAMLCKTSVARKILLYAWNHGISTTGSRIVQIDTMKHFSAAVDACFFSIKTNGKKTSMDCEFFSDIRKSSPNKIFGYHKGIILSHIENFYKNEIFFGKDKHYTWRSGLKHDSSKIMELRKTKNGLMNGYGSIVEIERLCSFPLLKSSDLGNQRVKESRLEVIVTQRKIGQSTNYIQIVAPLTWRYLEKYATFLDERRSLIYRNKPRFSIFGVGDYTFTDWKVAISGFYKRLEFQVVGPIDGKPVVFDDTIYFIGTKTELEAVFLADLLNSKLCQEFLESMIFWSDKRPITVELLKRVNLEKVALSLGRGSEYQRFTERNYSFL